MRPIRIPEPHLAGLIREYREGLTLDHLLSVPGMGLAKGAQILSAFELARRHLLKETVKIECAKDVLPLVADIAAKPQEHFVCISLNGANEVIEKRIVTIGLLDKSPVHPREVFADVIADRAAASICAIAILPMVARVETRIDRFGSKTAEEFSSPSLVIRLSVE
jgi:DNA repair protein RadC